MSFFKPHDTYKADAAPAYACDYRHGMPLHNGHYIALMYIPKQHLPNMLEQWRAWCKVHPKNEWPFHVTDYADQLKRDGKRSDLLQEHTGE